MPSSVDYGPVLRNHNQERRIFSGDSGGKTYGGVRMRADGTVHHILLNASDTGPVAYKNVVTRDHILYVHSPFKEAHDAMVDSARHGRAFLVKIVCDGRVHYWGVGRIDGEENTRGGTLGNAYCILRVAHTTENRRPVDAGVSADAGVSSLEGQEACDACYVQIEAPNEHTSALAPEEAEGSSESSDDSSESSGASETLDAGILDDSDSDASHYSESSDDSDDPDSSGDPPRASVDDFQATVPPRRDASRVQAVDDLRTRHILVWAKLGMDYRMSRDEITLQVGDFSAKPDLVLYSDAGESTAYVFLRASRICPERDHASYKKLAEAFRGNRVIVLCGTKFGLPSQISSRVAPRKRDLDGNPVRHDADTCAIRGLEFVWDYVECDVRVRRDLAYAYDDQTKCGMLIPRHSAGDARFYCKQVKHALSAAHHLVLP